MLIRENLAIQEKFKILTGAAKHDVTCTSSGVKRRGKARSIGDTSEAGICHSFTADGRCTSLLKILFINRRIHDCKRCMNRCTNGAVRAASTPDEVCKLIIGLYRRNYIEGLSPGSGILYNATYAMGQIYETMYRLRNQWNFNGYIHVKTVPDADPELMERVGFLADRMDVNPELPTVEGLKNLAPGKTRDKILSPMRQIQQGVSIFSHLLGYDREYKKPYSTEHAGFTRGAVLIDSRLAWTSLRMLEERDNSDRSIGRASDLQSSDPSTGITTGITAGTTADTIVGTVSWDAHKSHLALPVSRYKKSTFAPTGQSTQVIVGATPENDYQVMSVTQALYRNSGLKRVPYSAYVPVNEDSSLPSLPRGPPPLGEHRLYQTDWLLRFYGLRAEELLSEDKSNFNVFPDPECDWASRHPEGFPAEVSRVSYDELLRVPGMGIRSAVRTVSARNVEKLGFEDLKKLGVVLKRARYFITCSGRMVEGTRLDQDCITNCLIGDERRVAWGIEHRDCFRQLSLSDDIHMEIPVTDKDRYTVVLGNLWEVRDHDHLSV